MEWLDALGCRHPPVDLAQGPPRIVSLVPSLTELVCELGLRPWLAGRTGFCIHPRDALQDVPKVGGTKDVRLDRVRALRPTHLLANVDENEKPAVEELARFIPHVIVTHPIEPCDNLDLFRLMGGVFRAEAQAARLCDEFEREYAALLAAPKGPSKTVLYCIWKDPWMTVGRDTYIARMLELIGWRQWQAPEGGRYPRFEWTPALLDGIDAVLLSSEPYRFTAEHADALRRAWGKPVQEVDGEMLSWYGSRAVAGLRYLRELTTR
jgi:ABC-type Fe3+-hydroxamate transport system substrate-binding protein